MPGSTDTVKKVVFGLSNVHYAIYDEDDGTYGTPKPIPGGVSLSITREGNSDRFYADNMAYASFETNGGYTGELEMAYVPDSVFIDLLGYIQDSNGLVVEPADAVAKTFALLYEVSSNISPDRFVFYNCTLSRPENDANTTTDSTEPDTQSMAVSMIPRALPYGDGKTLNVTKGHITKPTSGDTSKFDGFFGAVLLPTPPAA